MRPRADLAIAPVYLVVFLAFAALILPVATTWVRSDVDAVVGTVLWSAQILAIYFVATRTDRPPRPIPLVFAIVLNTFLMGVVAMSVPLWVLDGQGEQRRATVVEVYDGHSGPATYTLAVGGVPIPGRLDGWPGGGTGAVGDGGAGGARPERAGRSAPSGGTGGASGGRQQDLDSAYRRHPGSPLSRGGVADSQSRDRCGVSGPPIKGAGSAPVRIHAACFLREADSSRRCWFACP